MHTAPNRNSPLKYPHFNERFPSFLFDRGRGRIKSMRYNTGSFTMSYSAYQIDSEMDSRTPRYSLIDGKEATLSEKLEHALTGRSIVVFRDSSGTRRYVSEEEWAAGAKKLAYHAPNNHIVTSKSPDKDKIALFRSLFKGREDVYAHGFSKRQGGIGYSPACSNERTGVCPRWTRASPRMKCSDCPARKFTPVNDRAIVEHFKGCRNDLHDVMGIYVLTADLKTWVLVADFDEKGWERETALYRDACRNLGLCPAVERSRSGNGAHVWLFFEEPIAAELARNLGCALITSAMSRAPGMTFESYDRLFPTQSTIPEGGFGNLIALPFQGKALKDGNSQFVDDKFEPYLDQWRFLSTISKVTHRKAKAIVASSADGPLGRLVTIDANESPGKETDEEAAKPDETAQGSLSLQMDNIDQRDMPKNINVIKSNMLCIRKEGIPNSAQNQIRRLAAFGNPEFYRAQATHQSVYGKQRIIWCGEEDSQFIMLPRGCERKLVDFAASHECTCTFEDRRNDGAPIRAVFSGTLRARQQAAADALLRYENGILMAPTGFGKTVIGAYIVGTLKMRTLIIVPKTSLIAQWKDRLAQFLDIEDDRPPLLTKSGKPSKRKRPVIGQIGGGKRNQSGIVDIATFQSLSAKDDLGITRIKPVVNDYELVICDECHYGAAPQLELVLKNLGARRVYGLSATPKRSDGLEQIIYMHCGPIRHKVSPKEQIAEQGFKRVLYPRFTRIRLASLERDSSFNQVVEALCAHDARNRLIVEDTIAAMESGRTPLVITKRKEHAAELARQLNGNGVETFVLTGDGTAREKREKLERIQGASDIRYALVATGSYIGEGFDLPRLDTLLLASPYSWEGVITQYSGRLHRESEGKHDVIVYDYIDTSIAMLERMYKKRLKTYAKLGYEITETPETRELGARIVTSATWRDEFASDLSRADKKVIISAPYANARLTKLLIPHFVDAVARGVEIRMAIRRPAGNKPMASQSNAVRALMGAGCKVDVRDAPLTGFAIFDGKTTWYGTLPLLAFARDDDCSLRIESDEVAADLEDALESERGYNLSSKI